MSNILINTQYELLLREAGEKIKVIHAQLISHSFVKNGSLRGGVCARRVIGAIEPAVLRLVIISRRSFM